MLYTQITCKRNNIYLHKKLMFLGIKVLNICSVKNEKRALNTIFTIVFYKYTAR